MVNTTLRAYLDELKLLLDQEALEEVMGHCRHILQHFPKNVETYRLLGRALLDKQRHAEAGDVFQRVLSALPNDFIAHLGMSSISEEQGQLPAAIWYLERATEQEPNNPALQDELKRLMEKRDGVAPERIQLTRGGLANIYAKGRLYEQAIGELLTALAQMPERVDLQLLLAQVYWESEHPVEAGERAVQVLEKLPDSLEANQILAGLWLKAGRPSDAAPFATRLEQLDPFQAWSLLNPDGKPMPDEALQLPRLDWDARAAAAMVSDVPDWVNSIGNVFSAPDSVSLSGNVTTWLEDGVPGPEPTSSAPAAPTSKPSMLQSKMAAKLPPVEPEPAAPFSMQDIEVPDWAQSIVAPGSTTPTADTSDDDVPDWFKDSGLTLAGATPATAQPADAPQDWFADQPDVAPEKTGSVADIDWFSDNAEPSTASGPAPASWLDDEDDHMPSGFTDLLAANAARVTSQSQPSDIASGSTGVASMPDWLADESDSQPAASPIDAMSWLVTGPLTMPGESRTPAESSGPAPTSNQPDDFSFEMFEETNISTIDDAAFLTPSTSGSDWLSATTPAESEASTVMGFDWLSDTSTPAPTADTSAAANSPLGLEAEPASSELDSADFDLSSLGFQSESDDSAIQAIQVESDLQADPLAWMSGYDNGSADSLDTVDTDESDDQDDAVLPGDAPDWLANMAPPAASSAPTAKPIDSLDFSSLNAAPEPSTSDWMSGSTSADSAASSLSLEDLDFSSFDAAPQAESSSVPVSDWMTDSTSLESAASSLSLEDLDFSSFDAAPQAESSSVPVSDWMTDSTSLESTVSSLSLEDLDFSSFDAAPQAESSSAPASDWMSASPVASSENSDDDDDADAWLAKFADEQPLTSKPASPSVEIEDEWLTSFETTPQSNEPVAEWLAGSPDTQTASTGSGEDWLTSFGTAQTEQAVTSSSDEDWLGSFATTPSADSSNESTGNADWFMDAAPAQAEPQADLSGWLDTLSVEQPSDSVEDLLEADLEASDQDMPSWMSGMAPIADLPSDEAASPASPPDSKSKFDDILKGAAARGNQPHMETGILDHNAVPDWLSATTGMLSEEAASSSTDFDFSDLDANADFGSTDTAAVAPGQTPNWLSDMAPVSASASSSSSGLSLDDLDFSNLGDAPASVDMPDWMSDMAPVAQADTEHDSDPLAGLDLSGLNNPPKAVGQTGILEGDPDWLSGFSTPTSDDTATTVSPVPRHSMPSTFPEVDFSDLDGDGIPDAPPTTDFTFDSVADSVARPANMVNTNAQSGTSFKFDQTPAWKRKKGNQNPPANDDLPAWLTDEDTPS